MKIGIVGSGAMGSGIAQTAAINGFETLIFDKNTEALQKAAETILNSISKLQSKQKLNFLQAENARKNILPINNLHEFEKCDLIIEAVIENLSVKKNVFEELETIVNSECIIATNTSSFTVTSIASACKNAQRVIGIHFFNPAYIMPLVEIIPALQTNQKTLQKASNFIKQLNKTQVLAKDTPGFIVNRIARPFYCESFKIYEEGIADFAEIDFALKTKGNFKMGPFELSDFIGHDVNYNVTESIWTSTYFDSRYKPSFCQKQLLNAGYLGKKTNKGFYDYQEGVIKNKNTIVDENLATLIFERVLAMLINEAAEALSTKNASINDIEIAIVKGLNYPRGLFNWANDFGIEKTVNILDLFYEKYKDSRYRCSYILREMNIKKTLFEF
ncbi:MAG: 3-hydroxybutyryl-CoA dehydrogenase [Bacteroidetes bacterium]|nr:3-hydroxybutyryl-CoA dehydrogenase [Bacteroidota bacterium]